MLRKIIITELTFRGLWLSFKSSVIIDITELFYALTLNMLPGVYLLRSTSLSRFPVWLLIDEPVLPAGYWFRHTSYFPYIDGIKRLFFRLISNNWFLRYLACVKVCLVVVKR